MPQPCSRPLTPNPFETYRDPATGRWLVRYPTNALSVTPLPAQAESTSQLKVEEDSLKRFPVGEALPVRRRRKAPSRTRVA
ncbi:MAG: hypothetical protein WBA76_21765 [Phormidesmis sp.]